MATCPAAARRASSSGASSDAVLLQACLNGDRAAGVPRSPEELARAAQGAVAAGAAALHVHPRAGDGRESLDGADIAAALAAIRAAVPGVPVGVSTGAWIVPDVTARLNAIAGWTVRPDCASVNLSEAGSVEVGRALLAAGIGIEAGLATAEDAAALVASGWAARCLRVLLEPQEPYSAAALATADACARLLDSHDLRPPRLLHGCDRTVWPVLDAALARGLDIRIGLEDTLFLPNGALAPDNAALVAAARRRARAR